MAKSLNSKGEMIMKEPKFKVGDWVTIKGMPANEMFHVLEIRQQTCEAGIAQVVYSGRHFFMSRLDMGGVKEIEDRWAMSARELLLREIELGELTEMPS